MSAFPRGNLTAAEISRLLAARIESLVPDLFPSGHREGREWCVGSLTGEPGNSLGIHLTGSKAGIWRDFGGVEKGGDALALVTAALALTTTEAMDWARRWLGLSAGGVELPRQTAPAPKPGKASPDPDRWQHPWRAARPIRGTLAEIYLARRNLHFDDPEARVLRFAARRARKAPGAADGEFQYLPALLVALSDMRTGLQCGVINTFLLPDGRDRIRDKKGKTTTGRSGDAVVLLSPFCEPTDGLTICEGTETGIALLMAGLAPVWACGGLLASFPVIGGIECLTIAADADEPGNHKAAAVAPRWCQAGREIAIIKPPASDWADMERAA